MQSRLEKAEIAALVSWLESHPDRTDYNGAGDLIVAECVRCGDRVRMSLALLAHGTPCVLCYGKMEIVRWRRHNLAYKWRYSYGRGMATFSPHTPDGLRSEGVSG